jgi:hypothetical protein
VDAAELQEGERSLAAEYGAEAPPSCPDEQDLRSNDLRDIEHWARVYTELEDFGHTLRDIASRASPDQRRAMTLQAKIQELHRAFWTDRLTRARMNHQSDDAQPSRIET